jgi:peptide chain release factor 1
MFDKTDALVERYEELNQLLSTPEVATNPDLLRAYAQEQAELEETVRTYQRYRAAERELADAQALAETEEDPEMVALIHEEIARLENEVTETGEQLKLLLVPTDPRDSKNVIVEVRAGAGGDEAGLFAADLFRMYTLYAAAHGWKTEVISSSETGIGGYKEMIFEVRGKGAYSRLKFESGVHRVQRVPDTEASGRIHTSTATVAVLPEADELDVNIDENEIRIDIYRAGGHGGQGVNTTDSAVRLTHLPTGIVVQCQNERSQLQNKLRAMEVLRARIYDLEYSRSFGERDEARRQQVGSGERSEKIRTYNFPQNRVTDHRIGMSIYRLEGVLSGELDAFIDELALQEQAERLEQAQEA